MSITLNCDKFVFLDHNHYIQNLFKNVNTNNKISSFCMSPKLFTVLRENTEPRNRKRSRDESDELSKEATIIYLIYKNFVQQMPINLMNISALTQTNTSAVKNYSRKLFESTIFEHTGINGGNNSDVALRCSVKGEFFLIPPNSRFMCGDINEQCKRLSCSKFDILVADPPWWNKYIRRLKTVNKKLSYSMMYNEDIANIPIKEHLADNCVVAVWCTNSPSNIAAIKNLIFPKWGVEYSATWYWLKVTTDFQPICDFGGGCKKQPFERLIIGKVGDIISIPDEKVIISVPSALHSHKPPLTELLHPYSSVENPKTLELFARYLLPNTTSVGYEPLKWQHVSLYEEVLELGHTKEENS